jgi:hypothetical protein
MCVLCVFTTLSADSDFGPCHSVRYNVDDFGAKKIKPDGSSQRSHTLPFQSYVSGKRLVFTTPQCSGNENQVPIQCISISCGAPDVTTMCKAGPAF